MYSDFANGVIEKGTVTSDEMRTKIKDILRKQIVNHQFGEEELEGFLEFLSHMLHLDPFQRKTAAELLTNPWLKNI